MPTYQYLCTDCGQQLEVVQKFTDDALTVCPTCEGRLRKVFSSVGIVFKGSGFYRNDSRAATNGAAEKATDGAGTTDNGSSSTDGAGTPSAKSKSGSSASNGSVTAAASGNDSTKKASTSAA